MGSRAVSAPQDSGYSVSAVARRLGVAPATLRTWDRRYGMSPSMRTAGAHRRYCDTDVQLLQRMQSFMVAGMPPADAARAAKTTISAPVGVAAPGRASDDDLGNAAVPELGTVVPLPGSATWQRGLYRAAACMDSAVATDVIRQSLQLRGVTWTWDEVIAPVLRIIGEKYEAGDDDDTGVDIEHHLSHIVIRELARHAEVRDPVNPRPILLASAPDEQHTLPLFALSAALAERGIASRLLGARTPDAALAAAVRRTGPLAVFIWAQSRPRVDLAVAVPDIRPAASVVVGGPGWHGVALPQKVATAQSLSEAVMLLCNSARPPQS